MLHNIALVVGLVCAREYANAYFHDIKMQQIAKHRLPARRAR